MIQLQVDAIYSRRRLAESDDGAVGQQVLIVEACAVASGSLSTAGRKHCPPGLVANPGMVLMSPTSATRKPAPADILASRMGRVKPVGAPRSFGSAEKEYCVLAICAQRHSMAVGHIVGGRTQIGRPP
jgi:hypothetical protein